MLSVYASISSRIMVSSAELRTLFIICTHRIWSVSLRCSSMPWLLASSTVREVSISCACSSMSARYECSYLLGVIFAVFFELVFSRNTSGNGSGQAQNTVVAGKIYPELMLIGITALLGNILGSIHIPVLLISVGNTASTLLVGLIAGGIVQRKRSVTQISTQILNAFRNLGLALFFTGTGFATGIRSVNFDIRSLLYGALITLTAIFCGILLCRIMSSRHRSHGGFVIAGGMTSSP